MYQATTMFYALYNGIVTLHIFHWLQDVKKLDKGCSLHSRTPCPYADAITYTLLPLLAPGTTCRATSRPHHLCLFSEAVWKRTSSGVLSYNFCSVPAKWLLSLLTLRSFIFYFAVGFVLALSRDHFVLQCFEVGWAM